MHCMNPTAINLVHAQAHQAARITGRRRGRRH
jgi:hypothetical protein